MKEIGLYVHIPFCIKKCNYCDFISVKYNEEIVQKYVQGIIKEIEIYGNRMSKYAIKTIFFGGGTPSILKEKQLNSIIAAIHKYFNMNNAIEFTMEANPGTLSKNKLINYSKLGVNRLSIGLQAYDNDILKYIGRTHDKEQFVENYYLARGCGFNNISVDLIYGLPGQSFEDWKYTLKKIVQLGPEHFSAYSLKIEEGTKFYNLYINNELKSIDEDCDRKMHHYCIDYLREHDIYQYEISNFSKKEFQCKHNLIYWNNEEYIGLGVAAHSYIKGTRFSNTNNIDEYCQSLNKGIMPIKDKEITNKADEIFETIFLGLRLIKGLNIDEFKRRFGISIYDIYEDVITRLNESGLLRVEDKRIMLTRYGMDISNRVFSEFIIDEKNC